MSTPEARVSPALPREGIDRCYCGAKYWAGDTCASCGHRWKPWHSCAVCGDADPDFHDPTVHGGQALCEDCYLELRPA